MRRFTILKLERIVHDDSEGAVSDRARDSCKEDRVQDGMSMDKASGKLQGY